MRAQDAGEERFELRPGEAAERVRIERLPECGEAARRALGTERSDARSQDRKVHEARLWISEEIEEGTRRLDALGREGMVKRGRRQGAPELLERRLRYHAAVITVSYKDSQNVTKWLQVQARE